MALVEVRDLVKRYTSDGPNAVDGISFDIHAGEMFSLLGPNGAGKTTAISVLSTLLVPTAGTVQINGHDVLREPMAVRRSIGVVPQDLALYYDLTAEENLRFWGEMRGLYGPELRREIEEKLALTELTERAKSRVRTFSGGMRRRLNLAIGLLGRPELVMLDEPTVAIDPQSRRYILDWVKQMAQSGTTVLYTTHYMEEAQELSDRIGIIDQGKLIAIGTLDELVCLVGEHTTLVLQMVQDTGAQELAASLEGVPDILQISATDGALIINAVAVESILPKVVTIASGLGLGLRNIEIQEPNLESVFLHLTGRALRD